MTQEQTNRVPAIILLPLGVVNKLAPEEKALLIMFHERHIGITPELARELAPVLLRGTCPLFGFGQQICGRLAAVFNPEKKSVRSNDIAGWIKNTPEYTILRIISPLIVHACQKIREIQLFCDQTNLPTAEVDKNYHKKLSQELDQLCKTPDTTNYLRASSPDSWELFWQETAYMLRALNKPQMSSSKNDMPAVHPPTAAFLFRLHDEPKPKNDEIFRRLHDLVILTPDRKQGGIQDIRVGRGLDDIEDMVFSEWVNPSAVWQDRVINSGYLAIEREARKEKRRDMLFMGVMPAITRRQKNWQNPDQGKSELSAEFAKVCWFNFIAYVGQLLWQAGLTNSEFRWIEEDKFGRIHIESYILPNIYLKSDNPRLQDQAWVSTADWSTTRIDFLNRLQWLPHFVDKHTRYHPLSFFRRSQENVANNDPIEKIKNWLHTVHKYQLENADWDKVPEQNHPLVSALKAKGNKLAVADFLFAHEMIFMPTAIEGYNKHIAEMNKLKRQWYGQLKARIGFARNDQRRNVNVVWTPPAILPTKEAPEEEQAHPEWGYTAPQYRAAEKLISPTEQDVHAIAVRLVETWLDELAREITYAG